MNFKKALLIFTSLLGYACGLSWLYLSRLPALETHFIGGAFLAAGVVVSFFSFGVLKEDENSRREKQSIDKWRDMAFPADGSTHELENVCLGFFERESAVEISRTAVEFLSGYFSLEAAAVISSDETSLRTILAAKGIPEDLIMTYWEELLADLPERDPAVRPLIYRPYSKPASNRAAGRLAAAVCPLVCRNAVWGYLLILRCGETKKFSTADLNATGRFGRYLAAALALAQARACKVLPGDLQFEVNAA